MNNIKNLKLSLTLTLLMACVGHAFAQGGFGGVTAKVESISGSSLMTFGGGGAWMPTENFYLGGGGYGSMNTININDRVLESFGYGGLMAGYKLPIIDKLSLSIQGLLGSGGYVWDGQSDRFQLIEPSIHVWLRVNHFMAINIGGQYRWSFMDANSPLSAEDLSAGGVQFSLIFGAF